MAKDKVKKKGTHSLAEKSGMRNYQRGSNDLIYQSIMRGGGAPFGAPFESGLASLTERIVKRFKLHSFFGFETIEKLRRHNKSNKFTQYGAAPYLGEHSSAAKPSPTKPKKGR